MGGTIVLSPLHVWHVSNVLHRQVIDRSQQLAAAAGEQDVVDYLEPKLYIKYLELEPGNKVSERALGFARDAVADLLRARDPWGAALLHRLSEMFVDWEAQRRDGTAIPRVAVFWSVDD